MELSLPIDGLVVAERELYKMRKPLSFVLAMLLALLFQVAGFAQCPSSITTSPSTEVAASCPSSGQITVNSSASSSPSATYQITIGPTSGGFQTTSQSSNIFTGLPAGNYTIRITCGTQTAEVTASVADDYTPLSLTATITGVCSSGGGGGNNRVSAMTSGATYITAYGTGGKGPIMYAFLKSNSAAEPDSLFNYSSSEYFLAPSIGVYQVRVKDACNNFITRSVDIQPLFPQARLNLKWPKFNCDNTQIYANLTRVSDSTQIDPYNSGYAVDVWYLGSTDPCTVPTNVGPNDSRFIYSASDFNYEFPDYVEKVLIRTVSSCGEIFIECVNIPKPDLTSHGNVHVGCSPSDSVGLGLDVYNGTEPYHVTVQGYDASNVAVAGTSRNFDFVQGPAFSILPAHHYIYTVTDSCGRAVSDTLYTPVPASGAHVGWFDTNLVCTNVAGTANITGTVYGYIPNQDASTIKLVNAATNSFVANASGYAPHNGAIYFENIPPGEYKIVFTPTDASCEVTEIPFSLPGTTPDLIFALDGSTKQLCGGAGTIEAELSYNGAQSVSFEIWQDGSLLDANASGSFTNLAPGDYTLKAIVELDSDPCFKTNMEATKDLTIEPEGSVPVVVKKLGINCTNDPATGIAVFEFSGFGPFKLEMKKVTDTVFVTIDNAVANNYTASPLAANTDYDVRITDQCGKTSVTQVSIKPLVAVYVTNTVQPCVDQPYTLSAEEITNASYSWTFNGGGVMATSREIVFGTYGEGNNGTYVCTITLGDCITKVLTVNLSSVNCGIPLNKSGLGDYVWFDSDGDGLQATSESGVSGVTVTLYAGDGLTVVATTTTDATGYYHFPNLLAGDYVVGFSNLPTGYGFTDSVGSLNDPGNSDADGNGKTGIITLGNNEFNMNIDAGITTPLPVVLSSFTAVALEKNALLSWSTVSETQSDRFEIETSRSGKNWLKVGSVPASRESDELKHYTFLHQNVDAGTNLYRLKMVDSDMTYVYSRVIALSFSDNDDNFVVFPNPTSGRLFLKRSLIPTVRELSITDLYGRVVYESGTISEQGVNVEKMGPGTYVLRVRQKDGSTLNQRIVIVR